MITFIDRSITRYAITPLAVRMARAKGRDNYAFGGRLLVQTSFFACGVGMLYAFTYGEWKMFIAFLALFVFGFFAGSIWVHLGEREYGITSHVRVPKERGFTHACSHFVLRFARVMMSVAMVMTIVFWLVHIEKAGIPGFLFAAQIFAMWVFFYVPTVRRELIEPHIYWGQ